MGTANCIGRCQINQMEIIMSQNRVLSRRGARELTANEVSSVSGGSLKVSGTKTTDGRNDTLTIEDN
jgi:hypothetical protein